MDVSLNSCFGSRRFDLERVRKDKGKESKRFGLGLLISGSIALLFYFRSCYLQQSGSRDVWKDREESAG